MSMLDLLGATDIVAGSLDQYLAQRQSVPIEEIKVKQGCDLVLQWLTHDGLGLKRDERHHAAWRERNHRGGDVGVRPSKPAAGRDHHSCRRLTGRSSRTNPTAVTPINEGNRGPSAV